MSIRTTTQHAVHSSAGKLYHHLMTPHGHDGVLEMQRVNDNVHVAIKTS